MCAALLLILRAAAAASGAPTPEEEYGRRIAEARSLCDEGEFRRADAEFEGAFRWAVEHGLPHAAKEAALVGRVDCLSEVFAFRDLLAVSRRLLAVQEEAGDAAAARRTRLDVGFLEVWLGSAAAARPVLEEALVGAEAAGEPEIAAAARARLADAFLMSGQFGPALRHALAAEQFFEEAGDRDSLLEIRFVLASLRHLTGDPEGARAMLLEAAGWIADETDVWLADILLCLGRLHLSQGDPDSALRNARRAARILRARGDLHRLSDVLLLMGDCEGAPRRRARAALRYLLAFSAGAGSASRELAAAIRLARLLLEAGRTDDAAGLLRYAAARTEALGEVLTGAEAAAGLAEVALLRGDALGAREALLRSLDLVRLSVSDLAPTQHALTLGGARIFSPFRIAGRVARTLPSADDALALLERVRVETARRAMGEDDRFDQEALGAAEAARLAALRARIREEAATCAAAESTGRLEDIRAAQAGLAEAFRRCQDFLAALPTGAGASGVETAEIRRALRPGEALVIFVRCGARRQALVVTGDGVRWADLGSEKAIRSTLAALRAAASVRGAEPDTAAAVAAVVAPLALSAETETVIVCPDGPLGTAPWPLLLPDRTVVLLPSPSALVRARGGEEPPGQGVLAIAAPALGANADPEVLRLFGHPQRLPDLPGARREVDALCREGDVVLLGPEASETRLRQVLVSGIRWRSVHFACHGLPNADRPAWAALVLAPTAEDDGFLTVSEAYGLRVPADLVVLSACETALGREIEGEGVLGLPAALLAAGASRVVASLWKVDDEAARIFMSELYARFRPAEGPGVPAARALREAREALRARAGYAHPVHWAGWVLWGRPD